MSTSAVQQKLAQAFAFHKAGEVAKAEPLYREILQAEPKHFDAMHMLGVVHLQTGRNDEAVRLITKAVRLNPSAVVLNNQGNALQSLNRYEDALASYDQALAAKPDYDEARKNRGAALQALQRHEDALAVFSEILSTHANNPEVLNNTGVSLFALGRYADALSSWDKALRLAPGVAALFNNRGDALRLLERPEEALASYAQALAIDPAMTEALLGSGGTQRILRRFDDALKTYDHILRGDPKNLGALSNKSVVLRDLLHYDEALVCVVAALALKPHYVEALINRGTVLHEMGRDDAALASFDAALKYEPGNAEAHWNKALSLLSLGDLARGWTEYEWRWQRPGFKSAARGFTQPLWQGEELDGALLLWGEQGVGDELLYASMVGDLVQRGLPIIWEADKRLVPLFQRSLPHTKVIARMTPPDPVTADKIIHAQISSASLGQHLRRTAADFPARLGYLRADETRAKDYRQRLLGDKKRLVGVSWVSKNPDFGVHKSSRLSDWAPLWQAAGEHTQFVDLQYGDTIAERNAAPVSPHHLDDLDLFNDIDGLAALIAACDLVITVSNTTAHLAGALGVPVWVLVPPGNGKLWYWNDAVDARWYSAARVFKQEAGRGWPGVIGRVAREMTS